MAATNYTPIQLYHSTTLSAVPVNTNLVDGELAINIRDGKLYYKDNAGVVQVIATKATGTIGGTDTQVQYNSSGSLAGSANFTFNGTTATINTLNLTNALGAAYGGTAQTSYTAGDIIYATGATALAKLGIGLVNYVLTSTGSAPQWTNPTSVSVSTATNLAGGAAGSVPYQSGAGATTFLSIGAANRVLTSTGSAPQWVTSLTGLTSVSSNFDTLGGSGFTLPAVLSATAPAKLYINTSTVTDGSSAIGATNTLGAIASFDGSTVAATNANVTYTNLATLVINAAPTAGTNVTITNPYALYIAAGQSYFASTVTVNGTLNATTLDLTNLEVTNIKAKDGTAAMSIADSTGVVSITANPILSGGTQNGVVYLNSSRVATTGSALTFDGSSLAVAGFIRSSNYTPVPSTGVGGELYYVPAQTTTYLNSYDRAGGTYKTLALSGSEISFQPSGAEQMRLTSDGLEIKQSQLIGYSSYASIGTNGLAVAGNVGIGTSSPASKLHVTGSASGSYGAIIYNTSATGQGLTVRGGSTSSQDALVVQTYDGNTSLLSVQAGGNVGIGTGSPATKLHVSGAGSTEMRVTNTTASLNAVVSAGTSSMDFGTNTNHRIDFYTNSSLRATLDTSGNLGLGVTPSAWAGGYKAYEVNAAGLSATTGAGNVILSNNSYYNGTNYIYKATGAASDYVQTGGQHWWRYAPSGTANTTSITSGTSYTVMTLGSTTLGQWQTYFSALGSIPSVGQSITATATGTLAGGATVSQNISFTQAMTLSSDGTFRVKGAGTAGSTDAVQFSGSAPADALRLEASGVFAVGTTGAVVNDGNIVAAGSIGTGQGTANTVTQINIWETTSGNKAGLWFGAMTNTNVGVIGSRTSAGAIAFQTYNSGWGERARITGGGDLLVGTNSTSGKLTVQSSSTTATVGYVGSTSASFTGSNLVSLSSTASGTGWNHLICYSDIGSTTNLKILGNGDVQNANNSYGAISDAKLKENVTDATPKLEKLNQVRVVNFNMIGSEQKQLGVIAQELEQIFPGMVEETPDRDKDGNDLGTTTKSVKYSVFVPMLIKAMQEQQAMINELKAEVAALKGN